MTTHDVMIALADGPMAGELSGQEYAVLVQYIRRADAGGVSYPSSESIAERLGYANGNHVRAARARLVELGILEPLPKRRGPRGLIAPYRLNVAALRGESKGETPDARASRIGTRPKTGLVPKRDVPEDANPSPIPGLVPKRDTSQNGSTASPEMGDSLVPKWDIEAGQEAGQGSRTLFRSPAARDEATTADVSSKTSEQSAADGAAEPVTHGDAAARNGASPARDGEHSPPRPAAAKLKTGSTRERKLTDEQNAGRVAFIDWWTREAYPAAMQNVPYPFKADAARNGSAVKKLLEAVDYDLARAKAIASAFLRDGYARQRACPLHLLAADLTKFITIAGGYAAQNGFAHDSRQRTGGIGYGQSSRWKNKPLPPPVERAGVG